ncbi:winged helix-turn-helix domain-containing protein (plasmid) [Bradyrhizobium sp. 183]|uniref:ATP-binding protein n=1 Tax=unclassified Bradyrhizobium TaxID=2631580 RepID=UPI001FFFEE88|nr:MULTISPECIES: winged helix-turn-helix domain-containing protein [unclassified Bradyrhizobium]UPJ84771.1 winged helix-turn-helix domain-containing protein [Bradyrhizobium sp. 184]UPJ92611.1 winged helix-turn-helix domain-containing protein [Bradyrhizobium sp. 183]
MNTQEKYPNPLPTAMADDELRGNLRFGPFELSSKGRALRRDGVVLPLGSRALEILIYLAERPGKVIAKQELIDHVWPDVTVEDGSIRVHVAAIRKALADGQFGNRYIANIKGRGYSFVGTLASLEGATDSRTARSRHQGRLPVRPIMMIGRETFVTEVGDRLLTDRFVTLLGPGGIGKTTIALAVSRVVAEAFGSEIFFVDLESVTDPHHVAAAVATSLGFSFKSKDPGPELVDLIRSRKLLIILDSCEHVVEAVASLAEQFYQQTEEIHVLTTSRELLKVEGEHCCRVLPLDFPPGDSEQTANAVLRYAAVQLFVRRVATRAGRVVLSDQEAPFVAGICRKLDGIPLAIELAAGQVATLGLENTVDLLVSRLELLRLSRRTAVARHRTLKATLDWSYDLLSDAERIVFRRIAAFVGHFTLDAARSVAGEPGVGAEDIFDAVAGLVEKSLITNRIDVAQAQYRLPNTTRAYALAKLEEHAEVDMVFGRHAEYLAGHLEALREALSGLPGAERVAAYSDQLSNVRAALEWSFGPHGDAETATRLAAASTQVFLELSLLIECQAWAERAMVSLGNPHRDSRRAMEISASIPLAMMHTEGNDQRVRTAFVNALEIAIEQGDLRYELRILSGLFMYSHWTMDIRGATDIAIRSRKLALRTGDHDDMALAEAMLAASEHLLGNHLAAQLHCESGLRHLESGPCSRTELYLFHYTSFLLVGMARSLLYRGLLDQSLDYARRAREEGQRSGNAATFCRSVALVLPVFLAMADLKQSDQYIGELSELSVAHSLMPYRAIAAGLKGQWLLLQDNRIEAIQLLKRALEELHVQRHEMLNMDFTCDLAAALVDLGEHDEALTLTVNAIAQQQRAGKFLHMPALFRMKGLILASRSAEDHVEAEESLLSAIDWAKRQSATLFELTAATDLAGLLLKQDRLPEAYEYLSASLDRMPAGISFPARNRAVQMLDQLQSGTEDVG